ncbi:BACON domain-containing protein [Segatella copri]|uniref:BACON domain-containing protein n=1 Tax=Segatella copri TaxID=165179 RepID=A0AA90ZWY6_9BACT|nr:BACON domain-containing carbohydrate-binding protein [Segatella copri]MQN83596.1 BACON domain-containing protein [Segatella copri]
MKKIKHLMIWIGLLLSLVSCKDTMEAIGLGGDEIPAEGLVLNLQLTNFTKQQIGTRAGTSETFNSLWAVFYGDNNEYLGKADCFSTLSPPQSDGSYKVKITNVPAGTKNVHLVANASDMTESEAQDLQSLTDAKERDPQLDAPICWGKISIDKLLEANPSVPMLRQCAKISLEIDKGIQGDFTNAGLYVYNMANKAAIAPTKYIEPTTDDLAESTDLKTEDNPLGNGTATTVAVNETSAGKAMVIIKAKYKKSVEEDYREGYYKVALYKDANKTTQYALLRNHHYTIKVIKVNDYGFSTPEEAKKSQPENRLEVEVRDDNPEITRMIACKDYELGVSDYQEINANTTEATVTIVTTLSKATSSEDKLYDVKINNSWITAPENDISVNDISETSTSSKGKKYTLKLTLEKNNQSEKPRTGIITVTSGDLSLDITIKQMGFDFRKEDPARTVTMQYNNSTVADNYFSWLDGVQGITPEDMQGAVRNDGLHFCVGTANITYLIPYLDGDIKINNDSRIKVEKDNGKWKVSLTNTTANKDLWKSSFTIINKAGIKITYPVYHTGIFHKIDEYSKVYTDYQLAKNGDDTKKVKGWFYYGVVKVEGKKADETSTTYYMLDRNLGASNNGYYAPDVVALKKNKKAIGGYFCISEKKSTSDATQDLSSVLAPEGYTIPTDAVFEELVNAGNLEVVPQSTSLGETYNCVRIKTVDSELPYIYLPMGGFLEGESHKNPIHVNLWTKTLLSGTQGFSTTSHEYGFWYRYFDVYNKRIGLSNMRFVSGSNGMNNGRYKAMPIRLILKLTSDK